MRAENRTARPQPLSRTLRIAAYAFLSCCSLLHYGGDATAQTETLKVAALPITPVAPLFVALDRGFFKDEGLTLDVSTGGAGGASNITAVIAGDAQIGFSDLVGQLLALDKGLKLQGVVNSSGDGGNPNATSSAVYVKEDSPIRTAKDLAGKIVAVNLLNNISDLTTKGALKKLGVDPASVKFVEVPIPQHGPAVAAGRVDAAVMLEPFITAQAQQLKLRPVLFNYVETIPTGALASYFTTAEFAAKNPDAIARFRRAMIRAADYSAANPEAVRDILTKFTKIAPAAAQKVALAAYDQRGNEGIDALGNLAKDFGLVKPGLDVSPLKPPAETK